MSFQREKDYTMKSFRLDLQENKIQKEKRLSRYYIGSVTGMNETYLLNFLNTHCDSRESQLREVQLT